MCAEDLRALLVYPDDAWLLLLLRRDPFFEKIAAEKVIPVLETAKMRGAALAERWIGDHGSSSVEGELHNLRISIHRLEREQRPPLVVFAALKTDPASIDLYLPAVRLAARQFEEADVWPDGQIPDTDSLCEIVLAHEAFHYLDETDPQGKYRETVSYTVGPFRKQAHLRTTDEVSAAVFAAKICKPHFHPGLMDAALLCAYQGKKENCAAQFLTALDQICRQYRLPCADDANQKIPAVPGTRI